MKILFCEFFRRNVKVAGIFAFNFEKVENCLNVSTREKIDSIGDQCLQYKGGNNLKL